jgi:hypothetical protein
MNRLRTAMSLDMTTDELRSRLGRVEIWMPPERIGVDPAATTAAIERAGSTSVWVGGGNPLAAQAEDAQCVVKAQNGRAVRFDV